MEDPRFPNEADAHELYGSSLNLSLEFNITALEKDPGFAKMILSQISEMVLEGRKEN